MRPFALSIRVINDHIEEAFSRELAVSGFAPAWSTAVVRLRKGDDVALSDPSGMEAETTAETADSIDRPDALLGVPPADWPEEVLALWQMGFIYLHVNSNISSFARVSGPRILLRECRLGDFGVVEGYNVLLKDSKFASHYRISGPALIQQSHFASFVCIGPYVDILDSSIGNSTNVHRGVELRSAWVAGSSVVEGGVHHRSHSPLHPAALAAEGIRVGRRSWIGQHTSLHPGTQIGEGVLVVSGSTLSRDVGSHSIVMGTQGRGAPIDVHLRDLSADEAFRLGRDQGADAAVLPIYGEPSIGFRTPEILEVDYPRHGVLAGLAGPRIVDFQRGALLAAMEWLLPSYRPRVSAQIGESVRFAVVLDRPLEAHSPCTGPVHLAPTRRPHGGAGHDVPALAEVTAILGEHGATVEEVIRQRYAASLGNRGGPTQNEYDTRRILLALASAGHIEPPLLPHLEDLNIDEVLVLDAFAPALTAPDRFPPLPAFVPSGRLATAPTREGALVEAPASSGPSDEPAAFLHAAVLELVGRARVDRHKSFMTMGMDSLQMVTLLQRVEQRFGGVCPDLFVFDTIEKAGAQLVELLRSR